MKAYLRNALISKNSTIVLSIAIGITTWSMLSQSKQATRSYDVPVLINNAHDAIIECPQSVKITLQATRTQLQSLDTETLAVHIDGTKLAYGPQHYPLSSQELLLPSSIKVLSYSPYNFCLNKQAL